MAREGFHNHRIIINPNGDEPGADELLGADMRLMKAAGDLLQRHYPGHPWKVEVDHAHGMLYINIPPLTGSVNRYCIPLRYVKSDPRLACVVRGGGELLERYSIPRAGFDAGHFLRALSEIPTRMRSFGFIPH